MARNAPVAPLPSPVEPDATPTVHVQRDTNRLLGVNATRLRLPKAALAEMLVTFLAGSLSRHLTEQDMEAAEALPLPPENTGEPVELWPTTWERLDLMSRALGVPAGQLLDTATIKGGGQWILKASPSDAGAWASMAEPLQRVRARRFGKAA